MQPKTLKIITVILLTLVVLSPALVAIIVVWQEHLNFMATQNLLSAMKNGQQLIERPENQTIYALLWLIILAPIGLCLGVNLHNSYVAYRAAMRQRKIKILQRMWQQQPYPEEIIL
ncbi:hypothetical protein H6G41_17445 [Tolypothrix sp. FACHB-123]|uniref:hypothetical protein n=1 Tax=Tolypothrix sp. FACHB-123 TaxID=2692868 RepID=UPI001686ABDB|nr:hypothetical protein [Tolypothrix sp. FACHB-123]MBD2356387.1 hypothetical protein [Tolypothrix sp. FACHB-123]